MAKEETPTKNSRDTEPRSRRRDFKPRGTPSGSQSVPQRGKGSAPERAGSFQRPSQRSGRREEPRSASSSDQRRRANPFHRPVREKLSLPQRWLIFLKERFSPLAYLPLVILFVAMNGSFGTKLTGVDWLNSHLALVIPLSLSFFLRLRLFDEIKDYQTDLRVNPHRPLPRGLLRINQVKKMIVGLIALEIGLAAALGLPVFAAYIMGLCFSLLMFNEFFIGDFLRDKLTTYAVSHTFVSVLHGAMISLALVGLPATLNTQNALAYFLANWALFNLFEFARKSFAASEEREQVPTYSNTFGITGAWLLSASQVLLAHGTLYWATGTFNEIWLGITVVYGILSCYYLVARSERSAKWFRQASGLFLLVSEITIIYWLR